MARSPRWRLRAPAAAACLFLAASAVAIGVPSASAEQLVITGTPCGGRSPAGYVLSDTGTPGSLVMPTGFNPQTIALFTGAALKDTRNDRQQRTCWAKVGAAALLANSRTFLTSKGARARAYPYLFTFTAHPAAPVLTSPWYSALGQASALLTMKRMYEATKDPVYLDYARQSFEVFTVRGGRYAVVSEERGLTFLQEYPTTPATYVLNGNNDALLVLRSWAESSGDTRASALTRSVLASLRSVLPLYEIDSPTGIVTSYDLLRGTYPSAPLRAVGDLGIAQARITNGRTTLSALTLPVIAPAEPSPNVLVNPTLDITGESPVPTGWRSSFPRALTRVETPFAAVRLSSATAAATFFQDLPADQVQPGTAYRLSVTGALARKGSVASSSLVTALVSMCPGANRILARSQIRWTGRARTVDVVGTTPPESCPLRVVMTAQYPAATSVDLQEITLGVAETQGESTVPAYPVSVLDQPAPHLSLDYTGSGTIQGYQSGRWHTLTTLPPAAVRRRVDYLLPAWIQGRNINLRYHEHHVQELDDLGKTMGCVVCRTYGRRWLDVAPGEWRRLASLT